MSGLQQKLQFVRTVWNFLSNDQKKLLFTKASTYKQQLFILFYLTNNPIMFSDITDKKQFLRLLLRRLGLSCLMLMPQQ